MPVPDFQSLMLPVLQFVAGGEERTLASIREAMAEKFALTPTDLAELLPNGRQTRFSNRVGWASSYLKQARILESPRRASYRVTPRGREVLATSPSRIDIAFLQQFEEFQAFREAATDEDTEAERARPAAGAPASPLTPDELMRTGYGRLRSSLGAELLERVKAITPKAFEELVVDLLVRMGYGGSREDASAVVGRSGDEGIDGIIKEDRLGLDAIYVQAKRWSNTVGRPDIQRFAGALQGQRARKGVFMTTSSFSAEAREYASSLQTTIVLIDGVQLAQLMLDYGVGVSESGVFRLWKLDEDYFEAS
ncbi:MAG: restriction endonuclease [Gemmatimonadota bacterium]